ncbi:MAG: preprotein translocase subunit SecG [Desulfomonile tiedjei]|nr:preprotein translocase subunit SecG [Desulfomonile tiedjei]
MFTFFILVIHIMVCIALILIILLQSGKGADIGAVFGGGSSQTVFGSSGAAPFLSRVTIVAAVVFMITSIILTYFSGRGMVLEKSVVTEQSAPVTPGGEGGTVPGAEKGEAIPVRPEAAPGQTGQPPAPPAPTAPAEKPGG